MDLNFNLNVNQQNQNKPSLSEALLYDVLVIGGGPAGLNAALYAKRKGLDVGIITKHLGGQVVNTSVVENYLGSKRESGESLVESFVHHIEELEVPIREEVIVDSIKTNDDIHQVTLTNKEVYKSRTIIIATGTKQRLLNIPGEKEFTGKGVAYCAICDAPLFKGMDVVVCGGGNSAVEAALDLSKVAKSVAIVHRSQFRADQVVVDKLYSTDNININLNTQILKINGDKRVTDIQVKDKESLQTKTIQTDGVFVEIGYDPNSQIFDSLLSTNERNEILVDEKNQTNIPGIFAAGDVTNIPYKQIIISASEGAKAALAANDYLNQINK